MLFRVAALWNIVNGLAVLVMPSLFLGLVYHYDAPLVAPFSTMYRFFWAFVVAFGVGYWRAADDLASMRGALWLGVAGKTIVGVYWLAEVALGVASPLIVGGALGDLVFAALFVKKLREAR